MKLREVSRLLGAPVSLGNLYDLEIERVVTSSLEASANSLFFARDGARHLAKDTVCDAVARGCRAILCESNLPEMENVYIFPSKRAGKIAKALEEHLYFEVLKDMHFIFVTGTKGKTTTARMVAQILNRSGEPCASSGTLGFAFEDIRYSLENTTPDIYTLLPYMARAKEKGARYCVLEVSSQALAHGRIDGIRGEYGIFTGISPDHIDAREHESFFDYREAKRRLFCDFGIKYAFAPRSISLAPFMTAGVEKEYFVDTKAPSDLTLYVKEMSKSDISYTDGLHDSTLPLCGEFHLQNAALALLCCSKILSVPPHSLYPLLSDFTIEGRGELLTLCDREILIDYAHNAESVEALARCYRPFIKGRMIALSGSVGDKALSRRRDLARALEQAFDFVVLTEDDTTVERREEILEELLSYFTSKERVGAIADRPSAIEYALQISKEGDMIFLLGKGHEHFLHRNGERISLNEREIIESYFLKNTE